MERTINKKGSPNWEAFFIYGSVIYRFNEKWALNSFSAPSSV
jgi:hypothetical protein